jgi:hypothetical protein
MWLLAAASLFMVHGAPLDMPRASAFLAKEDGKYRLVDRYSVFDLWTARAVQGRWYDDDFRIFTLSALKTEVPPLGDERKTREAYGEGVKPIGRRDEEARLLAIEALSPVEMSEEYARPRQPVRGYKEVRYYEGTNETAIVAAYLPEKGKTWYLATWELAKGDDIKEKRAEFEDKWLGEEAKELAIVEPDGGKDTDERSLLSRDVAHSVKLYRNWHFTSAGDFAVVDALPDSKAFVGRFTNEMVRLRARYREVLPGIVDGTNVLGVVRIFANRDEYLDVAGEDKEWTAAYWSQERREIVAYLPPDGETELLKTLRHEAFHQYLAYAGSMIMASPWINEGYAEYFEQGEDADVFPGASEQELEEWAAYLPTILAMDYEQFYGENAAFNYRMARSIACFLEKGAPEVRFEPFKHVKRDYMKELVESQDMKAATIAAFRNSDTLKLFVREWLKFYRNM